ncbi:MAG: hypothetical protein NT163_04510 [Chlorobiales bacterium]|nr:hypothetical protein [Chlorobiales bacterium]
MSDETKKKIRQLYQFLKEANQLRFRPVRTLLEQPRIVRLSDMPNHPDIQLFRQVCNDNIQEIPDTLQRLLKVSIRPILTARPLPSSLKTTNSVWQTLISG